MHLIDGVSKREIARRFGVDVKTVRRALRSAARSIRRSSPARGRRLDPYRAEIERLLREEPQLTAKRIGRLLADRTGPITCRAVRRYVAELRGALFRKEAFVHRTHAPGETMEGDFGESLAVVAGVLHRVKFFVAVLPCSNAYFAKSYAVERLECLLDGIEQAFIFFGGMPRRVVLDNTSLAVREVLRGRERVEREAFAAFHGAYPFHVDFCAPAKGWEKGSVEGAVGYVRDNVFRPMVEVASFEELDRRIVTALEEGHEERRLPDGRTVREALIAEREHLRPLPVHRPESCRVLPLVADKFGHVRLDKRIYSVPIEHAYRALVAKLFHDRVELVAGGERIARHARPFGKGEPVIDPMHVLPLLERKHRAVAESTAIRQWKLDPVFHELRAELREQTRKPDQEWVRVLRLMESHGSEEVAHAVRKALDRGSARYETIRTLLRPDERPRIEPAVVSSPRAAAVVVEPARLERYDELVGVTR